MDKIIKQRIFFVGEQSDINKMKSRVKDKVTKRCFDFNKIVPIPSTVYNGPLNSDALATYGDNNWYEWCKKNWGTFNNAYNAEFSGNMLELETNHGVPRQIYVALSNMFPTISFKVEYASKDGYGGKEEYSHGYISPIDDVSGEEISARLWA